MDGRFAAQKEAILARVRGLAPIIAMYRTAFDTERRLPSAAADALLAADQFRLWAPRIYGGAELTPRDLIDVIEAASAIDASLGWILTNGATNCRLIGYLPADTAREWVGQPDALMVGSTGALGSAKCVEGGYLVLGRWPYASGVQSARRIMGLYKLEDALCDPSQALVCCHFSETQIHITDNWHVSGLRGSGSRDFSVDRLFVAEHVDQTQQALGIQMLLENPSTYVLFAQSTIDEVDFLESVASRTGCGLLLDVNNVMVSCVNHGQNPQSYINRFPLHLVGEIHLGGYDETIDSAGDRLLIDAHGCAVRPDVMTLYGHTLARIGLLPTLIEWDNHVPDFAMLLAEAMRVDAMLAPHCEPKVA